MKQIGLIFFSVFMLNSILVAEPTISSTSTSLEERYGDRIEIFGLKFKGPLVLCQVLIAILMMITFLQSSFDKIINRKENLEFFTPAWIYIFITIDNNGNGVHWRLHVSLWYLFCFC